MKRGPVTADSLPEWKDSRGAGRARRRLMVRFASNGVVRTGFTKDISETGLFLQTNQVVRPGTTLEVHIHFPERTVRRWGRVMWAKKVPVQLAHVLQCGMGIRFLDPPADWPEPFERWKEKASVR
jgi:hypothetical protein